MKRAAVLLSLGALMVGATAARAQGTSFAGHWTLVPDANAAGAMAAGGGGGGGGGGGAGGGRRGGGGGGMGMEFTIAQDAKTLTITRTGPNGEIKTVYNLDGTESKNTMAGRGGEVTTASTAKWEGGKLTISTTSQGQNGPQTSTQSWSLDAGNLVIERQIPARGENPASVAKTTYKKG